MSDAENRRLSAAQLAAAAAPDGPLLIVAGPGAGKTRTLAARIAHLVGERRVPPQQVLALTFATAAAEELRARLVAWLGDAGAQVQATTFHAFGLRLARAQHLALGYHVGPPQVIDAGFARTLLLDTAATLRVPTVLATMADLAALVGEYRLSGGTQPVPEWVVALATAYEERLRHLGLIDFAGMLTLPLRLLAEQPTVLDAYQQHYRHLLVDEVQDVCPPQAQLLRLLVPPTGNLTVVGDPAQSLYGWRGADGAFLRDFPQHYPTAQLARLAENYRSSGQIVAVANALSAGLAHGQQLTTPNDPGPPARYNTLASDEQEADFIAAEVQHLLASGAVDQPGEIAILARTNQQLALLAPALRACGLLVSRRDDEPSREHILLTTIHRAKGREWRVVFVVGWEEGVLPHFHASGPTALVGEHHAAFVAVTRPRERLYLTACRQRQGNPDAPPRRTAPSRFLVTLQEAGVLTNNLRAA